MKQFFFALTLISPFLTRSQSTFVLKGTVLGAKDSMLVYLRDGLSDYPSDSTYIIKNRFTFKGAVEHPKQYKIEIPDPAVEEEGYDCTIWLENKPITISGTLEQFHNAKVRGSAAHQSYNTYLREVAEKQKSNYYDSVSIALTKRFIEKHPASYKSGLELYFFRQLLPFTAVKDLYSRLHPQVQQSVYGKELQNFIEGYTALKTGDAAPGFTFSGMDGKTFTLESLKGRYVLLVFWAPWCAPCREENKHYNHLYAIQDSTRLVMLGISLDKPEEVAAALKKDVIQWPNMFLTGNGDHVYANELLYRYGVWAVPRNFLIDPQGKIIGVKLNPYYEKKTISQQGGITSYQDLKGELNRLLEQLKLIPE